MRRAKEKFRFIENHIDKHSLNPCLYSLPPDLFSFPFEDPQGLAGGYPLNLIPVTDTLVISPWTKFLANSVRWDIAHQPLAGLYQIPSTYP
jgi:hypothetical protein